MSDLRTAAQQALEALESLFTLQVDYARPKRCGDAITALRAALKQPEQEPVAWMYVGLTFNNDMHGPHLVWKPEHMDAMSAEKGVRAVPLFTHPPRREWRGLTEEEFWPMLEAEGRADRKPVEIIAAFARAIEAALKERNG